MLEQYKKDAAERAKLGIPPLPISLEQITELCSLIKSPPAGEEDFVLDLLINRVPPGVDPAAEVKAAFLAKVAKGEESSPVLSAEKAVELLGTMLGGYNIAPLIELLSSDKQGANAACALANLILVFDKFETVAELSKTNENAKKVVESWANADWFKKGQDLPEIINCTVFKVDGETNTDDFSPAGQAPTRPDIPLHALAMGETRFPEGIDEINKIKAEGKTVAFVGDVVGTGSSRKSAANSLIWHIGDEVPFIPNKKNKGVILGSAIAPIFFNTAEDSGALPLQCDVSKLKTGLDIIINTAKGEITDTSGSLLSTFKTEPVTLKDEFKAGGRVNLIIGKKLTASARTLLGMPEADFFTPADNPTPKPNQAYTLAQKMVGKACGLDGVLPGTACEPKMTTVGSQDTTGPMTANEMKELACLGFQADVTLQSFCHTAAYPTPTDVKMQATLPDFISDRGGVALKPGDGIIHSWLNRFCLPDTVGTGGDSHTRFPIGISFPAGSGLVAFAAALGAMPLDMPESVLVRFKGKLNDGITLRDVVNYIPYFAIQQGLLTVEKAGKKNIFNGRILEIEGLPDLKIEQAFELADASAERSAAACTVDLSEETVTEYLKSNVKLLEKLIKDGYKDAETIRKRKVEMERWLESPTLLRADKDAEYAAVLEIDLASITEPVLACPNDPDDVKLLSEVAGDVVHEVFIGSCMTNIGHYRASATILKGAKNLPTRLWVCPPTRMDAEQLKDEGIYSLLGKVGARLEIPGCSLCMGNQARVNDKTTVMSTSTRNFNNRLGDGAKVYLGSAELSAVVAKLGKLPTASEYFEHTKVLKDSNQDEIYKYLNFHKMEAYAA
ncbi:MAG: bifunctional aconitate hydratase 2/2-methylisocitrate dehydratase [Nitrospinae bacterium]|nr:bifunctional aconitate hydratase 2/2-methylisocitrate dehydratase [Nitrospinota bacterium]